MTIIAKAAYMAQTSTPDVETIVGHLKAQSTFASLGDRSLRELAETSPIDQAEEGARLILQGETGHFAYLVLEGDVSVEVETDTGPVTVAVLTPGNLVGEIAAFAARPRTATVSAMTDVSLLRLEQATIRALIEKSPETAMSIIAELGGRLESLNSTIAALTQAAHALSKDAFDPQMLEDIRAKADRFAHFADVFEDMAAEIARKRQHAREMETAADIQRSFLPADVDARFNDPRFEVGALMEPAKQIGGDFYDYFMIDPDTIGVAVGDVSGKGIPAAMFMSVARTVLKTIAREGEPPATVLSRVNDLLAEDNAEGMFVTIAFGKLNLTSGAFEYATAGHEEALAILLDGALAKFDVLGPAIGLFEAATFEGARLDLTPGETVIFATDGITEAFNPYGGVYGPDRFDVALRETAALKPSDLAEAVKQDVHAFAAGAPQSDDITCLALRYFG